MKLQRDQIRARLTVHSPLRVGRRWAWAGVCLWLWAMGLAGADFQGSHHIVAYDTEPFLYTKTEGNDPVARLQKRLEKGELKLAFRPPHGFLLSLLEALDIPVSSQVLVFSKTSLHRDLISPEHPRALYFNDDVYVGWVRWAPVLEISAADPEKGGMFYVLGQNEGQEPQLARNLSCLECHVSQFSMGVPGHLLRSVPTDADGRPGDTTSGVRISHNTPYSERRGGWYVTGHAGRQNHLGNLARGEALKHRDKAPVFGGDVTNLSAQIDTSLYPLPDSDLIALMVLEHQAHMHNFIARLNHETTLRLHQYGHIQYVHPVAESFLKYLLFADEPPLPNPVRGTSRFAEEFEQRGPRDRQGRSLRALDLQTRLFKYPCSYLIYSEAFEGLPQTMKEYLYRRLWTILTNQDDSGQFEHLRTSTRRAILEILLETKPHLPEYWKMENIRGSL